MALLALVGQVDPVPQEKRMKEGQDLEDLDNHEAFVL